MAATEAQKHHKQKSDPTQFLAPRPESGQGWTEIDRPLGQVESEPNKQLQQDDNVDVISIRNILAGSNGINVTPSCAIHWLTVYPSLFLRTDLFFCG